MKFIDKSVPMIIKSGISSLSFKLHDKTYDKTANGEYRYHIIASRKQEIYYLTWKELDIFQQPQICIEGGTPKHHWKINKQSHIKDFHKSLEAEYASEKKCFLIFCVYIQSEIA